MKKNKNVKLIVSTIIAAVVISVLVSGVVVRAQGGQTVLEQLIELLKLSKEVSQPVAGSEQLGAQVATSDDQIVGKFNCLALATDKTTAANDGYQNFRCDFIGLVGSATNTPVAVKNTWAQTVYMTDGFATCIGVASTTISVWAGTSTLSAVNPGLGSSTGTLTGSYGALMAGNRVLTGTSHAAVKSGSSSTAATSLIDRPLVPVLPNEYGLITVKLDNNKDAVTSTADRGCSEIVTGFTILGISTSTPQY